MIHDWPLAMPRMLARFLIVLVRLSEIEEFPEVYGRIAGFGAKSANCSASCAFLWG